VVEWIENAIPSRLEVKDQHTKNEHGVMPALARLQELPPVPAVVHVALSRVIADCVGAKLKHNFRPACPQNVSGQRRCHSAMILGAED